MKKAISFLFKLLLRLYQEIIQGLVFPILLYESKADGSINVSERLLEYGFALNWLQKTRPMEVLDVGSGKSAWPRLMADCGFKVMAIDKISGYWKTGFFNRHFRIVNEDITQPRIKKKFDFITCISVLEHINHFDSAVSNMFQLLNSKGHILLTVPYNEEHFVENIYKHPNAGYGQNYPFICRVYSRKEINRWIKDNGGTIVAQEYYQVFTGEYWTMGDEIAPFQETDQHGNHQLTCLLIQKK